MEEKKEGAIYVSFGIIKNGELVYGEPILLKDFVNRTIQGLRLTTSAQVDETLDWR